MDRIQIWSKPADSYNASEDDKDKKQWSEKENPNNPPMPIGQISPKVVACGPGKGFCPLCHVAVVEVCRQEGVDEDYQHPVQEQTHRHLGGKIFAMSRVVIF